MARPVTVNIPHALGKDEARRRIEAGFGNLRQHMTGGIGGLLSFQQRWEGDRLQFEGGGLGQKVTGRIEVLADSVQIQLDLPEMLALIADRIAGTLKKEGQKLLEKK
jgi:putative polyhydroxyalkanoate system protein